MRTALALLTFFLLAFPATADSVDYSNDPRVLGPIVVSELEIRDGKLIFRATSGGCTDAASFVVHTESEQRPSGTSPHYRVTIRRVRVDECKAFLPEGVLIEMNLEADVGLTGRFTVSVENPVLQMPAAPHAQ